MPGMGCTSMVRGMIAVSVREFVAVPVNVPLGVAEINNERVAVLKGRGLLVVVAGRLGVKEGSGLSCVVGVDVETLAARFAVDGSPVPINLKRIAAKSSSAITLKRMPRAEGRSLNASRVIRPKRLASIKCAIKTSMPCGQIPSTPEPRPKPPALMGK